jgi:hypothetical protein
MNPTLQGQSQIMKGAPEGEQKGSQKKHFEGDPPPSGT